MAEQIRPKTYSRRAFARFAAGGVATALLSACTLDEIGISTTTRPLSESLPENLPHDEFNPDTSPPQVAFAETAAFVDANDAYGSIVGRTNPGRFMRAATPSPESIWSIVGGGNYGVDNKLFMEIDVHGALSCPVRDSVSTTLLICFDDSDFSRVAQAFGLARVSRGLVPILIPSEDSSSSLWLAEGSPQVRLEEHLKAIVTSVQSEFATGGAVPLLCQPTQTLSQGR